MATLLRKGRQQVVKVIATDDQRGPTCGSLDTPHQVDDIFVVDAVASGRCLALSTRVRETLVGGVGAPHIRGLGGPTPDPPGRRERERSREGHDDRPPLGPGPTRRGCANSSRSAHCGRAREEATARTTNATIVDRASLRTANLLLRKGTVSGARGQCRTRTVRLRVRASKRIPAFRGAPRHHAVSVNRSLPTPTRFPRLPEGWNRRAPAL